jgi:single-strand DNA-binding protein
MSNLNKVMLIGRLGRDPEIRYTKGGSAVANIRMATTDFWKDKQGNRQERTEWHTVVAWGRLADLAQNYLKKGRLVYVEGRLQTRDWTDNQNVKRYATEIVANNIQFLERREEGAQGGGAPRQEREAPPPPEEGSEPMGGEYLEDDIPF